MTTAERTGITAEIVYQRALCEYETVGAEELGAVYQQMMQDGERAKRKKQGSYYTPEIAATAISRFSLGQALQMIGPESEQIMRITACDPACGSGIFLVGAARFLSHAYASRLAGEEPSGDLMLAVMPRVILNCVFGVDIDPVAAELARLSLSLETVGALTPEMLARHVVCDNVLDGPDHIPPAMRDKEKGAGR